jgi:ribose transport system substrate-binding protein
MTNKGPLLTKAWVACAAVALTVAACSSSGSPHGSASSSTGTSPGSSAAGNISAAGNTSQILSSMQPITKWFGPTQNFAPPAHKHIMILICGAQGGGCVREGQGAKAAAEALGWTADVVDGKLDPTEWNRAVKQAAESGVDGIYDISGNPNVMGDAMAVVRAKHIPFVLAEQSPAPGDQGGIDSYIDPDPVAGGKIIAQWIATDSSSKAHVLILGVPGYADVLTRNNAIVDGLKSDCGGQCVTYHADISPATLGTTLAPLVTTQLQQHPDINYVWSPDDAISDFVAQGIQQAGKSSTVKMVSGAGAPEVLAKIKSGGDAADLSTGDQWEGWLGIDTLARVIAGVPYQKLWREPQRLWTAANIDQAPAGMFTSGWNPEFDYVAGFKKLWGVG